MKLVLPVVLGAAAQVQGKEGFIGAAVRADALSSYRNELQNVLRAEANLEYAKAALAEQAENAERLGLGDKMRKVEKKVRRKYRRLTRE